MSRGSLRQAAADTPLAAWIVGYGEGRGWETGRQAAKYLGVRQSAFATWLRGENEPGTDYQEHLGAVTGLGRAFFADLVRRTKEAKVASASTGVRALREEPVPYTTVRLDPDSVHAIVAQLAEVLRADCPVVVAPPPFHRGPRPPPEETDPAAG